MCLNTKYTEKQKQAYLKRHAKKGWLRVWKGVWLLKAHKCYQANCQNTKYKRGLNIDTARGRLCFGQFDYLKGYHFETTQKGGKKWIWENSNGKVIACYIKTKWVKTIGIQNGDRVVVCRRAVFPAYGRTEPYKKDLRAAGIKV